MADFTHAVFGNKIRIGKKELLNLQRPLFENRVTHRHGRIDHELDFPSPSLHLNRDRAMTTHTAGLWQPVGKRPRGRPAGDAMAGFDALLKSERWTFARQGFSATSMCQIARDVKAIPRW
jgi:hypothetical protein